MAGSLGQPSLAKLRPMGRARPSSVGLSGEATDTGMHQLMFLVVTDMWQASLSFPFPHISTHMQHRIKHIQQFHEELRGTPRNSEELQGTPRNSEELRIYNTVCIQRGDDASETCETYDNTV